MARRLAEDLGAAGLVVVSGLARGVDAAAHEAALPTGTIAVMAGGIDTVYPPENAALGEAIAERGLRLSEMPPGQAPFARHFPARNRIIAGLCRATVVVEAAARSGSLHTAREALDYGREVMAVPGHPMDARASGCNILIRDGALLVRGAEDVLAALGYELVAAPEAAPEPEPAAHPAPPVATALKGLRERLLALLGPTPTPEDAVSRDLGVDAATLARELVPLEIEGKVQRHPGGMISRA